MFRWWVAIVATGDLSHRSAPCENGFDIYFLVASLWMFGSFFAFCQSKKNENEEPNGKKLFPRPLNCRRWHWWLGLSSPHLLLLWFRTQQRSIFLPLIFLRLPIETEEAESYWEGRKRWGLKKKTPSLTFRGGRNGTLSFLFFLEKFFCRMMFPPLPFNLTL